MPAYNTKQLLQSAPIGYRHQPKLTKRAEQKTQYTMNKALRTEAIHYTVGSNAVMIARGLEDYDIAPAVFFDTIDLDLKTLDSARLNINEHDIANHWKTAVELSGDIAFGITAGIHASPTGFRAIGMSLWLCNSLKDGLDRLIRYTPAYTTNANAVFIDDGANYRMNVARTTSDSGEPIICDESLDAFISAAITTCRRRYGSDFAPVTIQLSRPEPSRLVKQKYEQFYQCPVSFNNSMPYLVFTKKSLDKTLPSNNMQLFELTEQVIVDSMNTLEISGIVGDIRNALKGLLPNGDISVSNISHSLNISSRSLQRKLLDQSLTYRQVLDDYRRELAIIYIRQPKLSQGEIGYQLGFSSPSNFSRAFKGWTGISPGEYRNLERA